MTTLFRVIQNIIYHSELRAYYLAYRSNDLYSSNINIEGVKSKKLQFARGVTEMIIQCPHICTYVCNYIYNMLEKICLNTFESTCKPIKFVQIYFH
jgi:hypothetical protein